MFAHSPAVDERGGGGLGRLRAAALGQALAEHLRPPLCGRGRPRSGGRGPDAHQHAPGSRDRHRAPGPGARGRRRRALGRRPPQRRPARRLRLPGRVPRLRHRRCRRRDATARVRFACCSPGPTPSRSARRPSPTRVPSSGCRPSSAPGVTGTRCAVSASSSGRRTRVGKGPRAREPSGEARLGAPNGSSSPSTSRASTRRSSWPGALQAMVRDGEGRSRALLRRGTARGRRLVGRRLRGVRGPEAARHTDDGRREPRRIGSLGVSYATVHAAGGEEMLRAAVEGFEEGWAAAVENGHPAPEAGIGRRPGGDRAHERGRRQRRAARDADVAGGW